ncbi:NAD(P)/FAD-dependent oxidoreductase [Roseovarius phycicola]|uniref:FAD-binding oxidoreductase n=1 Tax=Roseovarius phycicola TaxID=3080976 RepID=A0ABZ2HJ69_9RHOB
MQADVTILGAGIVGICTALALTERGLKVHLVDRDAPGQATSFGNAGVISPWSIVPQSMPGIWKQIPRWVLDPNGPVSIKPSYAPKLVGWALRFLSHGREDRVRATSSAMDTLNRDCVTLFRHHLAGTGHENLIRDSYYVHAFRDPRAARIDSLDNMLRRDAGAEVERIGPAELQSLEPALSQDFQAAILIKDQARAVSPGQLGRVLANKFRKQGGIVQKATVHAIRPADESGWTYVTNAGEVTTPKLVLAMGVWSAELLKPLGLRVPLQSERGYHVSFTSPGVTLNNSILDVDKKFVASSMEDGLRVAGTAEFAGLDAPENKKRLNSLVKLARHLSPNLNTDEYTTWSGQRPSLPDSLPCIGELEGFPNLITAFGHSHYGLMMAPKTGKIVADIATGTKTNIDLKPFRAERF